jgi:hypothetical protein
MPRCSSTQSNYQHAFNTAPAAASLLASHDKHCTLLYSLRCCHYLASTSAVHATLLHLNILLQTLEAELPDTAASMRLSSLELSDCLSEMGALGSDLSSGLRASAQLASAAESGVRQGALLLGSSVVPALARKETHLRGEGWHGV